MNKIALFYKKHSIGIWTLIGIAALFLVWFLISLIANTTLLPGPQSVIPLFVKYLGQAKTYIAIGQTLLRLIISIAISFILGLVFGIIGGINQNFRAFLKPTITVFRTIPTAAVTFVIIALLKPMFAPVIIVFLITFPINYDSVSSGISNVDPLIVKAAKVDGSNIAKTITRVYLPLAKNSITLGLVSSIGLGMKVSIMSEILAGSDSAEGLGKLIREASLIADMNNVLAYSLYAIIIIGLIDATMNLLKKKYKGPVKKKFFLN